MIAGPGARLGRQDWRREGLKERPANALHFRRACCAEASRLQACRHCCRAIAHAIFAPGHRQAAQQAREHPLARPRKLPHAAMLRAAAQQLARAAGAAGGLGAPLEAASSLRAAAPALTLTCLRSFSAAESPSSSGASEGGAGAGQGGAGGSGRPASKEWRTWVDAKLDSKLEGERRGDGRPGSADGCAAAAACRRCRRQPPACTPTVPAPTPCKPPRPACVALPPRTAALGQQPAAEEAPAAAAAAPQPAAAAAPAGQGRAKGWELEQQIYSIIA